MAFFELNLASGSPMDTVRLSIPSSSSQQMIVGYQATCTVLENSRLPSPRSGSDQITPLVYSTVDDLPYAVARFSSALVLATSGIP
jgi:hypothetical protein